ncbi:glycosyltransferase family 1 protein [Terasakiella sp. A23]|uniref:glycosyltransferase family 4 protein n=1 Tax=Terasakiella sp. FCG-A23 TaxID=3080561 RepID=UPI002954687F|nr:glycosyltransferase family 1 protein [Terasakiella sp. A23]MDV7338283.1 glycosyltransferase family 1 protein [Terasakiella sp. A23]
MRLLIVTDAWLPQINGVVRTHQSLKTHLERQGIEIKLITPLDFKTIPCPSYPEIRLSILPNRKVAKMIAEFKPSAIHISTEGPLGVAARKFCVKHKLPFTTAFHTRFPEYVEARTKIPARYTNKIMKWFHGPSRAIMTATKSLRDELRSQGFENVVTWTRGIDTELFYPREKMFQDLPRPLFMYVGRVAIEKNIKAFLELDLPGSKVVVGGGPQLDQLQKEYGDVTFVGVKEGEELAKHYASADAFVFPSLTDTFGLVLLEALASGVPVAAYPVTGPLDVIGDAPVGNLDEDLKTAALAALDHDPEACREYALKFSWDACTDMFLENLSRFDPQDYKCWTS